jgi:hypothetical protein
MRVRAACAAANSRARPGAERMDTNRRVWDFNQGRRALGLRHRPVVQQGR